MSRKPLSNAQAYALRAALGADRQMLIKVDGRYSTHFAGGAKHLTTTIESLIAGGLMQRVTGSTTAVALTTAGKVQAEACRLEYSHAEAATEAKLAHRRGLWQARRESRKARLAAPSSAASSPAEIQRRLPYADN